MNGKAIVAGMAAIAGLAAVPAHAAELEFDCDVPANHYSSVSQDAVGSGMISGTITLVELRDGDNFPVVGAGVFDSAQRVIAGFQLVAPNAQSKKLDVIFNVHNNEGTKRQKVGEIAAISPITFKISLSTAGKAFLIVNGIQSQEDASVVTSGRAMAFCSTAQYKFTKLVFSTSEGAGG